MLELIDDTDPDQFETIAQDQLDSLLTDAGTTTLIFDETGTTFSFLYFATQPHLLR